MNMYYVVCTANISELCVEKGFIVHRIDVFSSEVAKHACLRSVHKQDHNNFRSIDTFAHKHVLMNYCINVVSL
jgi:hypothetical protein